MTANEARKHAVLTILSELSPWHCTDLSNRTDYGFTLKVGGHLIRFNAQVESNKHPKNKKAAKS